jgi:uncharacterized protein YciI
MMKMLILIPALLVSMTLSGVAPKPTPKPEPESRVYVFSYLIQDQPELLSQEDLQTAVKGHRNNINVLSEQGKLLIAGPLFEPKIGELYSGIFVFGTSDVNAGMEIFETDPAVQAKVFKPEMYLFECADPLFELPRLKKEEEAERLADPDIPDAWEGRAYVLAIAAEHAIYERSEAVFIDAVMTPVDSDGDPHRLLFLGFETVDAAKEGFKAQELDEWSFYGWYGTKTVAQLQTD